MQYEEQLEECNKYKEFLTSLTPLEWFEEQAISKQQREKQKKDLQIKTSELEGCIVNAFYYTYVQNTYYIEIINT